MSGLSIEIPQRCKVCQLTGLDAVRCPFQVELEEIDPRLVNLVHCAAEGTSSKPVVKAGGKFHSWAEKKPSTIHQASRVGSGGRKR